MRIKHWYKRIGAALVASGLLAPSAARALDIPLGDPTFETYVVPSRGYAYAADPNGAYRPTSPWVDDLDAPAGYTQDDGASNWLYSASYAESTLFTKRPAPRTGNQAMHGLFNFSAQETSAVFEAGRTYTFSMWAQNDELLNETNGVFLYIFDGTVPFSDANALAGNLYTAINQRGPGMTAAQSQANWSQLSIIHTVAASAAEIGHPIGVGFFARKDSAVDDASLVIGFLGDFNNDSLLNSSDWAVQRDNMHTDLSAFTPEQKYAHGDLTRDGFNNYDDFLTFAKSYDSVNGLGAFQALVSIPEPTAGALAAAASVLLAVRRKTR